MAVDRSARGVAAFCDCSFPERDICCESRGIGGGGRVGGGRAEARFKSVERGVTDADGPVKDGFFPFVRDWLFVSLVKLEATTF